MSSRVPPEVWGPHVWYTYHVVASGFPDHPTEEDRRHYSEFYTNMAKILPCPVCTKDMTQIVANRPPDVSSRDALFRWTYDVHNMVAAKIGKGTLPPLAVVQRWYGLAPEALVPMVPAPPQPRQPLLASGSRPALSPPKPVLSPPTPAPQMRSMALTQVQAPSLQASPDQPRGISYRSLGVTGGVGGRNPEVVARATVGTPGPTAIYRGNTQFVPKKKGCGCGGGRR